MQGDPFRDRQRDRDRDRETGRDRDNESFLVLGMPWRDALLLCAKTLSLLLLFLAVSSSLSSLVYLLIQYNTRSSASTYTAVHFDFSRAEPRGNITLGDYKNQWTYSDYGSFLPFTRKTYSNVLKLYTKYQIDTLFRIAKSPRNQELGKVMVRMNMIDTNGDTIASSFRPLIVPYSPSQELTVRSSLLAIPRMLFAGGPWTDHYDSVTINMFNDYQEINVMGYRTKYIELLLSDRTIDVAETLIKVTDEGSRFRFFKDHPFIAYVLVLIFGNSIQFIISVGVYLWLAFKSNEEQTRPAGERRGPEMQPREFNPPDSPRADIDGIVMVEDQERVGVRRRMRSLNPSDG